MIKYSLNCKKGHQFESWFSSGEDYDRLKNASLVSCAVCGETDVEKAIMAPGVATKSNTDSPEPSLSEPASVAEQAVAELRKKVEANSEDVGDRFVAEARKIHSGDAPERSIIGQARVQDAKKLIDEGIPVAPLPWGNRKTN